MGKLIRDMRGVSRPGAVAQFNNDVMLELWLYMAYKHGCATSVSVFEPSGLFLRMQDAGLGWADFWDTFPYELREQGTCLDDDTVDALGGAPMGVSTAEAGVEQPPAGLLAQGASPVDLFAWLCSGSAAEQQAQQDTSENDQQRDQDEQQQQEQEEPLQWEQREQEQEEQLQQEQQQQQQRAQREQQQQQQQQQQQEQQQEQQQQDQQRAQQQRERQEAVVQDPSQAAQQQLEGGREPRPQRSRRRRRRPMSRGHDVTGAAAGEDAGEGSSGSERECDDDSSGSGNDNAPAPFAAVHKALTADDESLLEAVLGLVPYR
ncbi:hypothetical protein MNEG_7182 [Monoraphidium neglectum]|uniref:Uncharacterized protein n=1 Tax=Monoraphidium neglectum TaxID=145388 RepID=A0A0D2JNQ5_9CHLO|nr:hypothetical protein MNEG_7182 [Monoraphidium neglectum]KIZ00783.1 hypothetical protein MNEG_7182 [Monoraphidium neglectum]|eukprot:XP_013899802.1 hypothetical protein MNEG_7182 [Monoraphidium neglectum]